MEAAWRQGGRGRGRARLGDGLSNRAGAAARPPAPVGRGGACVQMAASGGEGTYRETRDIHIHDNFCRMGGYGWGCAGRESGAPMYCLGSPADKTENYVTEDNIFDRCLGYLVSTYGFDPNGSYIFKNNTYVQPYGAKFARIAGKDYIFDSTAASILEEKLGETTPILAAGGAAPAGGVKG